MTTTANDPIAPHAERILEHCNNDHPDALVLYCRAFGGVSDATAAVMTTVDSAGFDLTAETPGGPVPVRISYAKPASTSDDVREEMVRMATEAREKLGS